MKLKEKLLAIQTELKAPKNQRNTFGKYNYRSAEDILESLKPLLLKNKVTLTIDDTLLNFGSRFYINAKVTLHDIETDETLSTNALAREEEEKKGMDSSQITGSTSSYARKYALNGMFAIDDTKDADTLNTHEEKSSVVEKVNAVEKPKIIEVEKAVLDDVVKIQKLYTAQEIDKILKYYRVSSLIDVPAEVLKQAIAKKGEK